MTDKKMRVCPLCGRSFYEAPAVSRKDNKTQICPDCGTREALESIGVGIKDQDLIIEVIHQETGHLR